ncbi:hypothetical protein GCM10027176_20550 [Actinoallomurus bryophytorum]|uniref:Uncharacterized protein n=1 Tax=Actinoallomurus bryophytorum TaxID=1490222 RepID=A0A543CKM5_9ACTN|nr:hypothetical protein [Actinoallomurus bryophytorum]TQL97668.1 hypothetical protein FB559_3267 [Actinoallomurus bryophytorum]
MRRIIGAPAVAAAVISAALFVPADVSAQAADRLPTHFSEFTLTPPTVDVDHDTVTYAGRLVYTDTDGTDKGVPSVSVCAGFDGGCVKNTTTDTDGRFTTDLTLTTTGQNPTMVEDDATMSFRGNSDYSLVRTTPVPLHVQSATTRLSLSVAPPPSVVGDTVNVAGRLERQTADGGWTGAPGQFVRIYLHDPVSGADFPQAGKLTDADGRLAFQAIASRSAQWIAETPQTFKNAVGTQGLGPYLGARAQTGYMVVKDPTQIVGFNAAPEPVGRGSTLTGHGRLTKTMPVGANAPVKDGNVDLQFSADNKKWTTVAHGAADANGYFTIPATATGDGYWRATVAPGSDFLPSTGTTDYVDTRYRTRVTSFNASPEPVSKRKTITVGGNLQRYTTAWKAYSGQSVKVYFAAKGATTWTYEGAAKTNSTGHFSHGFKAAKDGTWRMTYAGNSSYLALTGSGDYVDVR